MAQHPTVQKKGERFCVVQAGRPDRCFSNRADAEKLRANRAARAVVESESVESRQVLTGAQANRLPDSSFAIILPGGRKDATGRTVPRTLRKLPYRNARGGLMREQAFNAISVLNGGRGGVNAPLAARIRAWNRIVAAIRRVQPGYVPPPRRF